MHTVKTDHHHLHFEVGDKETFQLKMDGFSGSMDLLLYLIENGEMDILNLDLESLTDQYLLFLSLLTIFPLDDSADFFNMAAHLLYLKSLKLIPSVHDEDIEGFEMDERQRFVEQLLEYQRYRQALEILDNKEQLNLFPPRSEPILALHPDEAPTEEIVPVSLFHLIEAFTKYLKKPLDRNFAVMNEDPIRVEDKIKELKDFFTNQPLLTASITFEELIESAESVLEIVVIFLALLELVKQRFVRLVQPELFGTIYVERNVANAL